MRIFNEVAVRGGTAPMPVDEPGLHHCAEGPLTCWATPPNFMAKKQQQQLPHEQHQFTDHEQHVLTQLGKMMGPQTDAFDDEVQALHDKRHQAEHDATDYEKIYGDFPHEAG
jgi:hypothetical protein